MKMINNFSKKMGDPKTTVIAIGDWSQKETKKFQEPTKGKSIRNLFRKNGYLVYLVDEFNTSQKSCINGSQLEKFLEIENPKDRTKRTICHGLLRHKDGILNKLCNNETSLRGEPVKEKVLPYMNRDVNGSINILKKAECIINGEEIPAYLKR